MSRSYLVGWCFEPSQPQRIISGLALEDHEGTVSIGGRTINNLRFADDIDGLAEDEELTKSVERLDKVSTPYGMEISAERTKLMTKNASHITQRSK